MTLTARTIRYLPFVALALALISFACFAVPLYVIWPFRHQGVTQLRVALFVVQIGPWLSIACTVSVLALIGSTWTRIPGWKFRSAAVLSVFIAVAGACLARLNVYELMFHPLGAPAFEPVEQAHLDRDDMVIAVKVNDISRAYPIREMGYHHIVNDTVGSEPIVATY